MKNNAKFARKNFMAIQTYNYEGSDISFEMNGKIMVNATQMARPFGKNPADFLKTQYANEFINALSVMKKIITADLLKVKRGGSPNEQGTWMHEDLAIEFARWLSPEFAIWCNDQIKQLIRSQAMPSTEQIKDMFLTGKIRFTVPEIIGHNGGKYRLMPSVEARNDIEWTHTMFYVGQESRSITTAVFPNGERWYNLPQITNFLGFDASMPNGLIRSLGYGAVRQLAPFGKGYTRYFISEQGVRKLGFGDTNSLLITGQKHLGTKRIENFEQKINNLISMVESLPEREFLIDLYKLLK